MAGSGIKELFEMIYAPKAVKQIMSGKANPRAVRAHLLLDAVLNGLLLYKSMDVPLPCAAGVEQDDAESSDKTPCRPYQLKAVESLYDELMAMAKDTDEVANAEAIARIKAIRDGHVETLTKHPTAILYGFSVSSLEPNGWATGISILMLYRRCFRTCHSLYAKSTNIYLCSIANLPNDHHVVRQHFVEGLHVARRSDHAWAGLSTDLMIEQVLMRSMRTSGDLTRARGMTEQQRLTWLLAMPACAEENRAMQELCTAPMNKTKRQVNIGKYVTRKTLTPFFSQCLNEIRFLRAHL